jgi:hypothetical protein
MRQYSLNQAGSRSQVPLSGWLLSKDDVGSNWNTPTSAVLTMAQHKRNRLIKDWAAFQFQPRIFEQKGHSQLWAETLNYRLSLRPPPITFGTRSGSPPEEAGALKPLSPNSIGVIRIRISKAKLHAKGDAAIALFRGSSPSGSQRLPGVLEEGERVVPLTSLQIPGSLAEYAVCTVLQDTGKTWALGPYVGPDS